MGQSIKTYRRSILNLLNGRQGNATARQVMAPSIRALRSTTQSFILERLERRTLLTGTAGANVQISSPNEVSEVVNGFEGVQYDLSGVQIVPNQTVELDVEVYSSVTNAPTPTGTVTIEFPGLGANTTITLGPDIINGSPVAGAAVGSIEVSVPYATTTTVLPPQFQAIYNGDSNYRGYDSSLDPSEGTAGPGVYVFFPAQSADKLAFVQQPNATAAGDVLTPPVTVALEDSAGTIQTGDGGSVTLSINSGQPSTTLTGTLTEPAVNGIATFSNLTLSDSGQYTLKATGTDSASDILTPATSTPFNVTAGKLVFVKSPTSGTADEPLNPALQVKLEDGQGNVITDDSTTVITLTTVGLSSGYPISGDTATLSDGIATFSNVVLTKTGVYQLQAGDGADTSATTSKFKVAGDHLVIKTQPQSTESNDSIPLLVEILNANNQRDVNDTNDTVLTLNAITGGANAVLSGTTAVQFVGGLATFTAAAGPMIDAPGTYTFTVTEEEYSSGALTPTNVTTPVTTAKFNIGGAHLAFVKLPPGADVDTAIPFGIAYENSKNQVDKTQNGAGVQLALTPLMAGSTAVLGGVTTGNFVDGIASFTATSGPMINLAGDYTLTATDPTAPGVTPAQSAKITIAGLHLIFKSQVTTANVAAPIVLTVELVDSENKLFTSENTATVQLGVKAVLGGANAVLSGTTTRIFTGGIASFTVPAGPQLDTAGTYRFTATETGVAYAGTSPASTAPGLSAPIKVTGDMLKFLDGPPKSANVNDEFPITVALVDQKGNRVVTQNSDSVLLSLTALTGGANAVLGAVNETLIQRFAYGAAQLGNVYVNAPGTYTLTATQIDATTGQPTKLTVPLVSAAFKIEGLHVQVIDQPKDSDPYQPIAMKDALEDADGKIDTDATGYFLSLALDTVNGGTGASLIGGTNSATPFVNGVAEFTDPGPAIATGPGVVKISDNPGTFDFEATAWTTATGAATVLPAKTDPFKILPLHLDILSQPADAASFGPVNFKVALESPNGKTDVYANYSKLGTTLNTLSGGSGASEVGSAESIYFHNGIATSTDGLGGVGVNAVGTYTFTFAEVLGSAGTAVPATPTLTTAPFKVVPLTLVVTQQPANVAVQAPLAFTIALEDPNGATVVPVINSNGFASLITITGGAGAVLDQDNPVGILFTQGVGTASQYPYTINVPGTYELSIVVSFQNSLTGATASGTVSVTTAMFTVM
jgi:hypothetical protein